MPTRPYLMAVCRVFALIASMAGGEAQRAAAQEADSVRQAVDHIFDKWQSSDGPGCAVGVSRNGQTVFEQGYGMANLETMTPIRPTSIFQVASISKQFTAAAIMLLERDGKLSLDDDIRKYVPEIPSYGSTIRIRHLLTHTSGLRDQWELLFLARGRFEEDRITEADVLDIIARQTALNFKPGTESLYDNTGYTLLGVIVKRITGKSLRQFAAERIFGPIGMTSTHFHDDYTMVVPGRTSAYESRVGADGPWRVSTPNYDVYGATNLFTTVDDLLKWEANFDRPIVGDAAMLARMQVPATLPNGDTTEYGPGLRRIRMYRGARVVESTGNDPGYQAYLARYPDHNVAIAVTCNAGSAASPTGLAHGVADVILAGVLAPRVAPVTQAGIAIPFGRLQSRVGIYVQPTTLAIVRLVMRDSHLAFDGRSGPTLTPLAENRFAVSGEGGGGGGGGEIVFGDGEHAGFERRNPGQRAVPFIWQESKAPSAAVLAPYAGEYVSDELGGAVYRVTAGDSVLMLRTSTADPLTAHLMFADTFVAGGYTIQFTRANRDGVAGFEVTNPRMRRVKFRKRSLSDTTTSFIRVTTCIA